MFILIILVAIIGFIATDLFVPSLPQIGFFFHQNQSHTQLTISLFLFGFAFAQLIYGPISDAIGRKKPLMIGMFIYLIGALGCYLASSFTLLCISRMIQGAGAAAGLSLVRVILRDLYEGKKLAIKSAQSAIFISLTPAVAPLIGGILQQHFGFRSSFLFMLIYGFFLLVLLAKYFNETIQVKNTQLHITKVFNQYLSLLSNLAFIRYVVIAGFAFTSIILYANIVPFILQNELHLSAFENGIVLLFAAVGISVGSLFSSRIVNNIRSELIVNYGLMIYLSVGLFLMASGVLIGTHLYVLLPALFLITMGCGFIFPNAVAICFSAIKTNYGIAGATYGFIQILIAMFANFLLNIIHHQGQFLLGLFYFLIGLIGVTLIGSHVSIVKRLAFE